MPKDLAALEKWRTAQLLKVDAAVSAGTMLPGEAVRQRSLIAESYAKQQGLLSGKPSAAAETKPTAGAADFGSAPPGQNEGDTGTLPDGRKVIVRKGRIVLQ